MRLAWATDIHLNFISDDRVDAFSTSITEVADAVVLTGDISEAPTIVAHLERVANGVAPRPVYFVLGNHDFYRGSIEGVRDAVRALCARVDNLTWLSEADPIELAPHTALVGCEGWGDARFGDFMHSSVMLNDYRVIEDLRLPTKAEVQTRLRIEGDRWGTWVRTRLPAALASYPRVIFATHVPPFAGACWHEGQISDNEWLPHFTCKAVGEALLACAEAHASTAITVLCGHTHSEGTMRAAENLEVWTGAAQYGVPQVHRVLEFNDETRTKPQ